MAGYYIDAAMLRKREACEGQVELFVQTFGEGRVPVNLANVKKAMAAGLDVAWPVAAMWAHCEIGTEADKASRDLRFRAYDATTPREILACLNEAPRIWQMVDAERATGGHR